MVDPAVNEARWYGGRHPSRLTVEEFMQLHCTRRLAAEVYEQSREVVSFRWLGAPTRWPVLRDRLQTPHGDVLFRQSGERISYVAQDAQGDILRDARGLALSMSEQEIAARGWPLFDETIAVFLGDTPIGLACNEWGAVGVWVAGPYQRCGIGTKLVRLHLETRPSAQLGPMTPSGMALARAVHRSFVLERATSSTSSR